LLAILLVDQRVGN
jgi:hypothetical protein